MILILSRGAGRDVHTEDRVNKGNHGTREGEGFVPGEGKYGKKSIIISSIFE